MKSFVIDLLTNAYTMTCVNNKCLYMNEAVCTLKHISINENGECWDFEKIKEKK
jgi:hypothetical protein